MASPRHVYMYCPSCGGDLIHSEEDHAVIRVCGQLRIDRRGQALGNCFWCKELVPLPLGVGAAKTFVLPQPHKP